MVKKIIKLGKMYINPNNITTITVHNFDGNLYQSSTIGLMVNGTYISFYKTYRLTDEEFQEKREKLEKIIKEIFNIIGFEEITEIKYKDEVLG